MSKTLIWKTNAKCDQDDTAGSIYDLKERGIRLSVHRIHGCGKTFYLTCPELRLSYLNLHVEDFDEAVKAAQKIVSEEFSIMRASFEAFLSGSENQFTRN